MKDRILCFSGAKVSVNELGTDRFRSEKTPQSEVNRIATANAHKN